MRPLQLLTFSLILINEALCTTFMFPFVGKFITHLDSDMTLSTAGYYSGVLVGSYQGAMALFCSNWGQVSDVIGRKPVFIIGLMSGAICMIGLGLSESLGAAITMRLIHGMLAANAPLGKTYAAEATTNKADMAKVFSLTSISWSAGAFVGPMIGGFLYEPSTSPLLSQFSVFSDPEGIFSTRPALLPCMAISLYTVCAAGLTALYLPESNPRAIGLRPWIVQRLFKTRQYGVLKDDGSHVADNVDEDDNPMVVIGTTCPTAPDMLQTADESDTQLVDEEELGEQKGMNSSLTTLEENPTDFEGDDIESNELTDTQSASSPVTEEQSNDLNDNFGWSNLVRHPVLQRCIPMYMALCAYNIIYTEVLPLYAIALREDGGLQLSTTDIGLIFTVNAAIAVVMNSIFPYFAARYPTLLLWRLCNLLFAAAIALHGVATFLNEYHSKTLTMGWIMGLAVFRCTASSWCFSLCMMFVANAAPAQHLGRVTGMSHACGSAMRSLWPLIAAPIFAWSITGHHTFPFNHNFVFFISMLLALLAFYLSLPLSEVDVNKKEAAVTDVVPSSREEESKNAGTTAPLKN